MVAGGAGVEHLVQHGRQRHRGRQQAFAAGVAQLLADTLEGVGREVAGAIGLAWRAGGEERGEQPWSAGKRAW